jgi:hypothetical protein
MMLVLTACLPIFAGQQGVRIGKVSEAKSAEAIPVMPNRRPSKLAEGGENDPSHLQANGLYDCVACRIIACRRPVTAQHNNNPRLGPNVPTAANNWRVATGNLNDSIRAFVIKPGIFRPRAAPDIEHGKRLQGCMPCMLSFVNMVRLCGYLKAVSRRESFSLQVGTS